MREIIASAIVLTCGLLVGYGLKTYADERLCEYEANRIQPNAVTKVFDDHVTFTFTGNACDAVACPIDLGDGKSVVVEMELQPDASAKVTVTSDGKHRTFFDATLDGEGSATFSAEGKCTVVVDPTQATGTVTVSAIDEASREGSA